VPASVSASGAQERGGRRHRAGVRGACEGVLARRLRLSGGVSRALPSRTACLAPRTPSPCCALRSCAGTYREPSTIQIRPPCRRHAAATAPCLARGHSLLEGQQLRPALPSCQLRPCRAPTHGRRAASRRAELPRDVLPHPAQRSACSAHSHASGGCSACRDACAVTASCSRHTTRRTARRGPRAV
jgi:hypothetical protein